MYKSFLKKILYSSICSVAIIFLLRLHAYGQIPKNQLNQKLGEDTTGKPLVYSNDSLIINGGKSYYGLLQHYNDSVKSLPTHRINQKDYHVKYDPFNELFKGPWIGDFLKNIIY